MHRRSTLQLTAIETEVEACVSGTVRAEARELAKGPGQMQGGDWQESVHSIAKHCKAASCQTFSFEWQHVCLQNIRTSSESR